MVKVNSLQEMHADLLNIMLVFKKFCEKENLRYSLGGGSVLGAVRHHGFIPWDDDVDIVMPRPDYEKMLDLFEKQNNQLSDSLKIISDRNPQNAFPFTKLVDTNIELEQKYVENNGIQNLWVDIFPIDGVPSDPKAASKFLKKVRFYRHGLTLSMASKGEGKSRLKRIIKPFIIPFFKAYGTKNWKNKVNTLARTYPYCKSDYVCNVVWEVYGDSEIMKRDQFENLIDADFEGHKFKIMANWDEYLTNLYGDYMQLPPENERETHFKNID